MKFAKIQYAPPLISKGAYWNLVLENAEDVELYAKAIGKLSAKQFWEVWCTMKKGYDYAHAHSQRNQATCYLASMEVYHKAQGAEISLADACGVHDRIVYEKIKTMLELIDKKPLRLTPQGGYCPLDDFFEVVEEKLADESSMREYLTAGSWKPENVKTELVIEQSKVIIENDNQLSDELYKTLGSDYYKKYDVLYNFKFRTETFTAEDFYKFFDDSIKKGLDEIIAETTLYDVVQFENLRGLLIKVMTNNPEKTLTVKILSAHEKADFTKYAEGLPENLKFILL